MGTPTFDEAKHPRAATGKFATKGYSEAEDGTGADLSMEPVTYVADDRAGHTGWEQDVEWAKQGKVRCTRCGGVGGSKAWRDWVCYECGGAKCVEGKPEEIEAILNPPSEEEVAAQAARVKAAEAEAEAKLTAQVREYVATDPALRALMDTDDATLDRSRFLSDMFDRVNSGGKLTERQLAALKRAVGNRTAKVEAKTNAAPVPTGKGVQVSGKVTSTRWESNGRGGSLTSSPRLKPGDS